MYVVTVEFRIKPGQLEAFMPLMVENARTSRDQEPGCTQFDVCADLQAPHVIFLYEVYDDRAAFDAHLATAHFKRFDAQAGPMVANKSVRVYERTDP